MSRISHTLWDKINHFASFQQSSVSLRHLLLFGQNPSEGMLCKASQFLAEELPIRLAHRIKELNHLPYDLNKMPSIVMVMDSYAQSFEELVNFPPLSNREIEPSVSAALKSKSRSVLRLLTSDVVGKTRVPLDRRYYADVVQRWPPVVREYNQNFTRILYRIKTRRGGILSSLSDGVSEWKSAFLRGSKPFPMILQQWLSKFHLSRIGLDFLVAQRAYIALTTGPPRPSYVGVISTKANVHSILTSYIPQHPQVDVQVRCDKSLEFAYVEEHLGLIVKSLVENSIKATLAHHWRERTGKVPPVQVVVVTGAEDITIKISDEGGGIPRSEMTMNGIWRWDRDSPHGQETLTLPESRMHARYFGGDLTVYSMDGHGTDVFVSLCRL
ncbi:pyruvate dehydrogenase kinase [Moniliophthora roreri]|nr:pyruvate dehydrogenase kinase [Moniliophthora roreri]